MIISDRDFFQYCLLILYLGALGLSVSIWFIPAPYGRLHRSGWGPTIPSYLAWCACLSPMWCLTVIIFPSGQHATNPKSWILISPFLIHYLHRTCIYPIRLYKNKSAQRFPIIVFVGIFVYSLLVAYLQAREFSHYKDYDNDTWFWWRVFGGLLLYVWGMWINMWADNILSGLKGDDGEYKIPEGGLFELVSCPNFFGELVEWFGWVIMTGSIVSLGYFFCSFFFLVPRAYTSHKWYLSKFEHYPKTRKAIFPFLF